MDYLSILKQAKPALIVSLPGNRADLARAAVECGADVIKVHMNVQHRASGLHFGAFSEEKAALAEIKAVSNGVPCGIVAGNCVEDVERDCHKAAELGYSFVSLYAAAAPVSVLSSPDMLKMIALAPGYTPEDIRQLPRIGADVLEASVMRPETYGQRLTVAELLEYAAIAEKSALPVVVPTQRAIRPEEIGPLASVGIAGIMIGAVVTGKDVESLRRSVSAFRSAIDRL